MRWDTSLRNSKTLLTYKQGNYGRDFPQETLRNFHIRLQWLTIKRIAGALGKLFGDLLRRWKSWYHILPTYPGTYSTEVWVQRRLITFLERSSPMHRIEISRLCAPFMIPVGVIIGSGNTSNEINKGFDSIVLDELENNRTISVVSSTVLL